MFTTRMQRRATSIVTATICLMCSACASTTPVLEGRGGYRDLEVPSRWGEYPLAGALARFDDAPGLDWVDHLTNCGLSGAWIEQMRAAWWSERRYDVQTLLRAQLDAPIGGLGGATHQVESVRIRYGKIGGETTAENGLLREARAKRDRLVETCPLVEEEGVYWIDEAIYADEVSITLETAAGDTLSGAVVQGLVSGGGHWNVAENGVMHSTDRVYVAFRNAVPARSLIEPRSASEDGPEVASAFELLPLEPPIPGLVWDDPAADTQLSLALTDWLEDGRLARSPAKSRKADRAP